MLQITPAQVLTALSHHKGKDNGIHVRELVQRITGQLVNAEALERQVRTIVTDLRMQGHHICAHPGTGYFMAATPEELNETCKFLVDRSMTTLAQVSRMKRIALPDLHGQLHLKT